MYTRSLAQVVLGMGIAAGLLVSACTLLVKTNQPPGICGDGVAKGAEACDGDDFRGKNCESLGLGPGVLACTDECTMDTTGCTGNNLCGNGTLDDGEQCDGVNLGEKTCEDILPGTSGVLSCTDQCTFDTSACDAFTLCGNGSLDEGEQCDGTNGVHSCLDYGFVSSPGTATCTLDCELDFSLCQSAPFADFHKVTTGAEHSCGIKTDNTVWCWGSNRHGQLGVVAGAVEYRVVPVQVFLNGDVPLLADQIGAGRAHTCVLELAVTGVSERLFCWGDNQFGQLGTGNFISHPTPLPVDVPDVQQGRLTVGHDHNCYFPLEEPRTVRCWGRNDSGQLGNNSLGNAHTPVFLHNPDNLQYKQIVAGGQHTCGVLESNEVYCWGNNGRGQLGTGDVTQKTQPTHVGFPEWPPGINLLSISAGGEHTCAILSPEADYQLFCWGDNSYSQLGLADVTMEDAPVRVNTSVNVLMVSAGMHSTCVMDTAAQMTCWGKNTSGQLGIGSLDPVTSPGTYVPYGGTQALLPISDMSMGNTHACAVELGNFPRIFCWGRNDSGQLGSGNLFDSLFPVVVNR